MPIGQLDLVLSTIYLPTASGGLDESCWVMFLTSLTDAALYTIPLAARQPW